MINKTKIICTIGPASSDVNTLSSLITKGMDIARLNLSHGDHKTHSQYIKNIRAASKINKKNIPFFIDLQGPKIRVGNLLNGSVELSEGQKIRIINKKDFIGTDKIISTTYKNFIKEINIDDLILLDDGLLRFVVKDKSKDEILCIVLKGGTLKEHKGINLPGTALSLPSLTEKDIKDLNFAVKSNADAIALSFVRKPEDIMILKKYLKTKNKNIPVIAKIERPEAISNIDAIIDTADIIMIARGDLGVELSPEDVPVLQKTIIEKCNRKLKPVITATQMLESMKTNRIPTRAEASDVANSIIDGTDCVMLSAETSVGIDPPNVIDIMEKIISKAEKFRKPKLHSLMTNILTNPLSSICKSSVIIANDLDAKAIITITNTGQSPLMLSQYRLNSEIISLTRKSFIYTMNNFTYGVYGFKLPADYSNKTAIEKIIRFLKQTGFLLKNNKVITIHSAKNNISSADTIKIINI